MGMGLGGTLKGCPTSKVSVTEWWGWPAEKLGAVTFIWRQALIQLALNSNVAEGSFELIILMSVLQVSATMPSFL